MESLLSSLPSLFYQHALLFGGPLFLGDLTMPTILCISGGLYHDDLDKTILISIMSLYKPGSLSSVAKQKRCCCWSAWSCWSTPVTASKFSLKQMLHCANKAQIDRNSSVVALAHSSILMAYHYDQVHTSNFTQHSLDVCGSYRGSRGRICVSVRFFPFPLHDCFLDLCRSELLQDLWVTEKARSDP